jgi:type I restriction enzyme S subunit
MRDGWVETNLGEVAEWWSGGTPKAREPKYYENGTIPWAVIADMNRGVIDSTNSCITEEALGLIGGRLAPVGSVLISMYASVGKSAIANVPLATNQAIAWSIPRQDKIMPFFLYLVSQQLEKTISDLARGATQRNINRQMLREFSFLLPPLSEQKRIVDLISSVDTYIEVLQQQLGSAKKSRNAVLHKLLTAGGDDWVRTSLGDVADVIDPHPSHRAPVVDDGGIPFIGIGDLRKTGDIDFAKARRVSKKILEEHKARYDRSDFLIGLGRVASIGMVVRLPDERTDYVVSPTLAVIKAKDMLGQFLFHLLEGPHSQEQFQRFKKGSTRESVGMQILRKIEVHVPPLTEQKRIVEIISSIDKVVDQTQLAISEAKNLRSGLLSDLLSGEHEIPASYDKVMGAA